jgi:hypothetical protein
MADRTARRILFSAQKNEGPFLLEWIAFHKVVGFTDIVIYSNDCTDGSDVLLDRLAAAGEVVHRRHDPGPDVKPQMNAARLVIEEGILVTGDWVMWLDLDEFLYVEPGRHRVDDLIAAIGPAEGVSVAWRHFGDGGNAEWPGRHVSPHFILAEHRRRPRPPQCKTLFRYGPMVTGLHLHRPLLREGASYETFPLIGSDRLPMPDLVYDSRRPSPWNRIAGSQKVYRLGQVAHFFARTADLYVEKKVQRGRGFAEAGLGPNTRHSLETRYNPNETEERMLLVHEAATVAEMGRLYALEGVAEACAAIRWFLAGPPFGETS